MECGYLIKSGIKADNMRAHLTNDGSTITTDYFQRILAFQLNGTWPMNCANPNIY